MTESNLSPIVVKIGGAAGIDTAALCSDIAELTSRGRSVVVVHGGSDGATRLQARLGAPARMLRSADGRQSRFTDREALETFAMATALLNRRIVETLGQRGVRGFGVSGLDGGLIRARRKDVVRDVDPTTGRMRIVRDQWTGRVLRADAALLCGLLDAGLTPVLAPVAAGEGGEMLNVDGDLAAAAVAEALRAEMLVLLSNVPGLLRDPADRDSLVESVTPDEFEAAESHARGRMRAKLSGVERALRGGVQRVVIGDAGVEAPLTAAALHQRGTVFSGPLPEAGRDRSRHARAAEVAQ